MYRISLLLLLAFTALVSYAQPFSGYISLDGTNDYAETASAGALLPSGEDFTVETWFRSCGLTGCVVDAMDGTTGEGLAISILSPGAFRIQLRGAGGPAVDTIIAAPLSSSGWQHMAFVYERATGQSTLFVSGRSFGSFVAGFTPADHFNLGKDQAGTSFYDGYLDEMRVSNSIRYTVPFNPNGPFTSDAQTLALWHFNEAVGSPALLDASAFNRDLTPKMGTTAGSTFAVSGGGDICSVESVSLNASGAVSFSWSPATGLDDPSSASPTATPDETTYYVVSAADSNSCVSLGLVQVAVRAEPEIFVTAAQSTICEGSITQLFAEGGVSYLWNTGAVSQNPFVNPEVTSTYTVQVTDVFGCTAESGITITVEECATSTGLDNPGSFSLSVGPNPTWGTLWVNLALVNQVEMTWNIYDAAGRLVRSYPSEQMASGIHQRTLDTKLENGRYWLVLDAGEQRRSLPFTVWQ